MVFQEPLTALNPLMKVGPQVAEIMISHKTAASKSAAQARAVKTARIGQVAGSGTGRAFISAPAVRRPTTARHARNGTGQ